MKNKFSRSWISSKQPRKQRKFKYNAPLNIQQKLMGSHLEKGLRAKYGTRSMAARTGDKVKVMRGQFAKREGKVERVDLKKAKVYITGIETVKKEGSKSLYPINPSNLMITELNLDDKRRLNKKLTEKPKENNSSKDTKGDKNG